MRSKAPRPASWNSICPVDQHGGSPLVRTSRQVYIVGRSIIASDLACSLCRACLARLLFQARPNGNGVALHARDFAARNFAAGFFLLLLHALQGCLRHNTRCPLMGFRQHARARTSEVMARRHVVSPPSRGSRPATQWGGAARIGLLA